MELTRHLKRVLIAVIATIQPAVHATGSGDLPFPIGTQLLLPDLIRSRTLARSSLMAGLTRFHPRPTV